MPGRRRKNVKSFRDLANQGATHFEVGHRSQKDPMLASSEASEHVLVPRELGTREKRLEEQVKYGVFYEDDYDYLQHLRDVDEIQDSEMLQLPDFQLKEEGEDDGMSVSMASTTASRLTLPSLVLGSTVQRDVGLLDMQAETREDWDPEILAALEDGFNFDDPDSTLEDDFILKATASADPIEEEDDDDLADVSEDEDDHGEGSDEAGEDTESGEEDEKQAEQCDEKVKGVSEWIQKMDLVAAAEEEDEEGSDCASGGLDSDDNASECSGFMRGTKPTVSKYSAAMKPRNENLQLIDRMHEALMKREYSEDQMGALDGERLGGRCTFDSDLWKQVADSFYRSQKTVSMKDVFNSKDRVRPVLPQKYYVVEEKDYSKEEPIDYSQKPLVTKDPQYDCETIRSTFSKRKHLFTQLFPQEPKKTQEEKEKQQKEEMTWDEGSEDVHQPGLSLTAINRQIRQERLADTPSTFRPKDETADEKRERKKKIKEMQKERRVEKSLNKTFFTHEVKHQKKTKEAAKSQKRMTSYS